MNALTITLMLLSPLQTVALFRYGRRLGLSYREILRRLEVGEPVEEEK